MSDSNDPFSGLDLKQAIDLRWTLRDIRAKRFKLTPIDPANLQMLMEMGLVEMKDDQVVLTGSGLDVVI